MEDQIGTDLHWSNLKEPNQAKIKDKVIRRNLDRIRISAATPPPSNPSRHSQVSCIQIFFCFFTSKRTQDQKNSTAKWA